MKIKLEVSQKNYKQLEEEFTKLGFIIDDDAELILSEKNTYRDYISCRNNNAPCHIPVTEIVYIESIGHDIIVHTQDNTFKCSERLWQLEKSLNPDEFLRISNSVIAAISKIKHIRAALSQKFTLTMSDGNMVDVTRTYYHIFKNKIGI